MNPTIRAVVNIIGSQRKPGEVCNVPQKAAYKWPHNKAKVSPEHVSSIINAANEEIQTHQTRPGLLKLFPSPKNVPAA